MKTNFQNGERLFAEDLNANFSETDSRLNSVQSGATNASNLSSGTVNTSLMPSGSLVQMGFATLSTNHVSTSSTVADTGLSITFTPKRANSKLVIQFTAYADMDSLGAEGQSFTYYVDRDNTDILAVVKVFEDDDDPGRNRLSSPVTFACVADSSSTSATTIKLQVAGSTGRQITTNANSIVIVYEVA